MLALTRKLCPFFSLMIMVGCGKKMTEPDSTDKPHIEPQKPSPTLILSIESLEKIYKLPLGAWFLLPDRLRVRSNNAIGKTVTITYNISPDDPENYEFKCTYKGATADSMPVEKCVDIVGSDMGDVTDGSDHMPMTINQLIKLESSSEELQADAIYSVTWLI
jgi:hypothetical protein